MLVVHEVGFVSSAFELRRGVCQSESRVDDCRRYALLAAVWHKQLQLMLLRMTQASTRCRLWCLLGKGADLLDPGTGRAWAPHRRRFWAPARRRPLGTGNGKAQRLRVKCLPLQRRCRPSFPWLYGEAARRAPAHRRPRRHAPSCGFTPRLGVLGQARRAGDE